MTAPEMVGRIVGEDELPGGAVLLMKRARDAGGWFTWATAGTYHGAKTEKARVLVKGRHPDGRRWVVVYLDGKVASAYVRPMWTPFEPMMSGSVAEVRAYIDGNGVPSDVRTQEVK